jgi:SAM-dependent methyltransferase
VGCGTGSLTLALAEAVAGAHITGIDLSQALVDFARSRTSDRRLEFERGDAVALPYADQAFDATVSLLVLNFIPAAGKAIGEMVRVTRPGGVVAAAVWDFRGGLPHQRVFLDTAAAIDGQRGGELRALSGPFRRAALAPALHVSPAQHEPRHPLGVARRIGDRNGDALRDAEQREALETERVHHRLEILHEALEGNVGDAPIGQPVPRSS